MCGRYASSRRPEDLAEEFEIDRGSVTDTVTEPLPPDYNVAPTKEVYAVVTRPPARSPDTGPRETAQAAREEDQKSGQDSGQHAGQDTGQDTGQRQLRVLRWGLVPFWAKDPAIGNRLINARVESVAEKPAFRQAFARRRCLLPADGYFEWYPTEQRTKGGKPLKQPFYIHPQDGSVLAMAGLYEIWRDPTRDEDDPERFRWTCTVLTTSAEDELGRIHDRMPLLVEPERYAAWLDPDIDDPETLRGLLVPAAPGRLEAYPVSVEVNNVRNNGPQLVAPLPLEEVPAEASELVEGTGRADDTPEPSAGRRR
jgi:putative SOS response-associated peptidase YedK